MYLKKELYALIQSDVSIFDFIQNGSLDGLWYWDLENPENEWMNARFWTVLGYHPDEMPHKSSAWQSIINQDDLKVANENFVKHCEDPNYPYDQLVRYTHKDGSTKWIRCRGLAIRDSAGKPIRMLGAHQDITELKRSEQELVKASEKVLESEEKYRAFYNNAPLSYQSLDENGCFIDINPMWSKTLGYERDEVIGKWYGDFLHPDYAEHFRINFPAFKKRGYVSDVQFKLRRKDNTYIYVSFEGCVGYTPEGKFRQTYCVFKDITEQKALENAIKKAKEKAEESEAKLNALFTAMSEMVVLHELVFDENGAPVNYRIIDCNDAFTRITGITRKNAIDRLSTEVYGVEPPPFLKEYSEVALTGEPCNYETYFQPMDKHFSISVISPKKNQFATVTADITNRKRMEETLRESEENLSITLHSIGDGVITTDKFGMIDRMNPVALKLCGWHEDEIKGKPLTEVFNIIDAETREPVPNPVEKVMENGEIVGLANHTVLVAKDGREYQIADSAAPIKDKDGNIKGIVLVFSDVSEKYAAEQALLESETSLQAVLNSTADGILAIGKDKKMLYANERFSALWRIPSGVLESGDDSILLQHILDQLSDPDGFLQKVQKLYDSDNESFDTIHFNDGRVFERLSRPLLSESKAIGRVWSFRDITERKQAEKALLAKMDELERFHKLTVGRELTMIELKKEVNNLLKKLGEDPKYKIVE